MCWSNHISSHRCVDKKVRFSSWAVFHGPKGETQLLWGRTACRPAKLQLLRSTSVWLCSSSDLVSDPCSQSCRKTQLSDDIASRALCVLNSLQIPAMFWSTCVIWHLFTRGKKTPCVKGNRGQCCVFWQIYEMSGIPLNALHVSVRDRVETWVVLWKISGSLFKGHREVD